MDGVNRLRSVGLMVCTLLAAPIDPGYTQSYPARPVRFVVPYPPGGTTDLVARGIAAKLTERWGQQVVVDNRGGASTIIGAELVARAAPDGYTILLATQTTLSLLTPPTFLYSPPPLHPSFFFFFS